MGYGSRQIFVVLNATESTFGDGEAVCSAWGGDLAVLVDYGEGEGDELKVVALLWPRCEAQSAIYHSNNKI